MVEHGTFNPLVEGSKSLPARQTVLGDEATEEAALATPFTLRELTPDDGPALSDLGEQTPDTGAVAFHSVFHVDPYAALQAMRPGTIGVVAETPDHQGLVGLGLMAFGELQYEGAIRPYAYLYSLSVHPSYRRMGIATGVAAWRVERAGERFGDDGVIVAGIQGGNVGSQRTAESWARQRVDRSKLIIAKTRSTAPRPAPDLDVRPAEYGDLEAVASAQNAFHAGYNLYPPETARQLADWRAEAPLGFPLHDLYVAQDRQGNLVAGLGITEEGRLLSSQVVRMPMPLRLADVALRIMPPGGAIRRVLVTRAWFAPGGEAAAAYLWESVRWLARDRGTTFMIFLDPMSSLATTIPQSRLIRPGSGSLVIRGPMPMDEAHLIYQLI